MEPSVGQLLEIIKTMREYNRSLTTIESLIHENSRRRFDASAIMELVLPKCVINGVKYLPSSKNSPITGFFDRFFQARGFVIPQKYKKMAASSIYSFPRRLVSACLNQMLSICHELYVPKVKEDGKLPLEILVLIFKRLDSVSAFRCMQVCESWKEAFTSLPLSAEVSDEEIGDIFWPMSYAVGHPRGFVRKLSGGKCIFFLGENESWRLAFRLLNTSPFTVSDIDYVNVAIRRLLDDLINEDFRGETEGFSMI